MSDFDPANPATPGASPAEAYPPAVGNTGPLGHRRSIGLSIVFFIITLGIYGAIWTYKTQEEIKRHSGLGVGGVVGLVIYLLIGIVTLFIVPSEIGQMYRKAGQQPPVTGWAGLWNLIPIAGTFIWFFKVQGALNRYWEAKGVPA
jgi:amino acid transporter